jgi:transcriptional regulator with XRE-family HTH domain
MTARDLAAACGFSVSTARRVLNGERALTLDEVGALGIVAGCRWSEVFDSFLGAVHESRGIEADRVSKGEQGV